MDKKFRLVCIFSLILSAISICWNTLAGFFFGFGINYAAVLAVFAVVFIMTVEDKELYNKTKDLFYIDLSIVCFETLVFMMEEYFGRFGNILYVFTVLQKIFSVFAILYFAYVVLKILFVSQGKSGNVFNNLFKRKQNKKSKKTKELINGSLSDKPQSQPDTIPVLEGQIEIENDEE